MCSLILKGQATCGKITYSNGRCSKYGYINPLFLLIISNNLHRVTQCNPPPECTPISRIWSETRRGFILCCVYNSNYIIWSILLIVIINQDLPSDCPKLYSTIIEKCWKDDPNDRPSGIQLLELVKQLQSNPGDMRGLYVD